MSDATLETIEFMLNGTTRTASVQSHDDLVDLVNRFDLFGTRESCSQGLCGCCTVLVDGIAVSGCLTPARLVQGKHVTTVEALDAGGKLSDVQQAFIDEGAFQCGFCTPGFIMMTHSLLDENASPSDEQIKDYLAGNLCRCAAYPEIVNAVHRVIGQRAGQADRVASPLSESPHA